MTRRLMVVVVAGLFAFGAGCGSSAAGRASGASSGLGGPAPASSGAVAAAKLTLVDGSSRSFADLRGTPVVVNFFSSTCVPCVAEMPALEAVNQSLGGAVHFVGIDPQDTVDGARSFAAAEKVSWDIALDADASLASTFGVTGLPTTFVLDRSGAVVYSHLGATSADMLRGALRDHGLVS